MVGVELLRAEKLIFKLSIVRSGLPLNVSFGVIGLFLKEGDIHGVIEFSIARRVAFIAFMSG